MLAAAAYAFAALLWFTGTPLGQVPVVDSHQHVALARLMADAAMPPESFHRAPLYPALLSIAALAGADDLGVYLFARAVNFACLILLAWETSRLAARWGAGPLAASLAFSFVAANPILIFYAGFAFDILPASLLGLWGFVFAWDFLKGADESARPDWQPVLLAGLCFAAAAQLRSHFLPVALSWPLLALWKSKGRRTASFVCAALPLALGFGVFALANHGVSGEWRLGPWQGAYNLYAGNGPQANGRYYAQIVDTGSETPPHENPAKTESILLYERLSGRKPPHTVSEMNSFWLRQTLDRVKAEPLRWLHLMTLKAYALLNNHEQYDNLSYSLHKEHSPWLRYNPLGWGFLFILALLAFSFRRPPGIGPLLLLCTAYAAGILLFYPTSRFRLPLVPLIAALAVQLPLSSLKLRLKSVLLVAVLGLALCFSQFGQVAKDPAPLQDHRILAYAALRAGQKQELQYWLTQGLLLSPKDPVLIQIQSLGGPPPPPFLQEK
jgi:hypothetical protein